MRHLPVLLLALAACAPNPPAPVKVVALAANKTPGSYAPEQVELKYVKDVVGLKGDVAKYVGGARIVIEDSPGMSDDQYARLITRNPGGDVHVNFIEKDGVLWPADFDSWNLVSSYYNFERAYDHFIRVGVPATEIQNSTVYYQPDLENPPGNTIKDNTVFVQPLRAFVIVVQDKLQEVPLPVNGGVIAHEFSHKLWNLRVYGGSGQPEVFTRWLGSGFHGGVNLIKSLDEGLADYLAYGATCDSPAGCDARFLEASLPDANSSARDLSLPNRCLSTAQRDGMYAANAGSFISSGSDYTVGTVIASSLYQAGEKTGKRDDLQKAILATYSDETAAKLGFKQLTTQFLDDSSKFKLELVVNAILAHIDDLELRKQTCNQFWARLKLDIANVPSCPTLSAPVQDCTGVP